MKFRFAAILVVGLLGMAESLDPYQLYAEGSCANVQAQPARNLDRRALDNFKYVAAGSRYHILRVISSHPRYETLRDDELYYGACMTRNTTTTENTIATISGFGRELQSFDIVAPRNEISGIYFDAIPRNNFPRWDILRAIVTLTDNRNFAFEVNCWVGSDQVGWTVISRTQTLDANTRRIVEEHARKLGFSPENTLIMRNDNCQRQQTQNQRERFGQAQGQRENQQTQQGFQRQRQNNQQNRNEEEIRRDRLQNLRNLQNLQNRQPLPQGPRVQGQDNSRRQQSSSARDAELGARRELVRPDLLSGINRAVPLTLRNLGQTEDVEDRLRAEGYSSRSAARGSGQSSSSEEEDQARSGRRGNILRSRSSEEDQDSRRGGRQGGAGANSDRSRSSQQGRQGGRQGNSSRLDDDSSEEQGQGRRGGSVGQRNNNRQRQSEEQEQARRGGSTSQRNSNARDQSRSSEEQQGRRQYGQGGSQRGQSQNNEQQRRQESQELNARRGPDGEGHGWGKP